MMVIGVAVLGAVGVISFIILSAGAEREDVPDEVLAPVKQQEEHPRDDAA